MGWRKGKNKGDRSGKREKEWKKNGWGEKWEGREESHWAPPPRYLSHALHSPLFRALGPARHGRSCPLVKLTKRTGHRMPAGRCDGLSPSLKQSSNSMQNSDFPKAGIRLTGDRIWKLCLTAVYTYHHINHIQAPLKVRILHPGMGGLSTALLPRTDPSAGGLPFIRHGWNYN